MSAELKVVLVSEDPAQLNAFDNPSHSGGSGLTPPAPPLLATPAVGGPPTPPLQSPVETQSTDLADIAKMLKDAIEKTASQVPNSGLIPPVPPLLAPPVGGQSSPPLQAPIATQSTDLADIAKMLKEALEKTTKPKAEKVEPVQQKGIAGVFDKLDAGIQKTLDNWMMRNTRSGAAISNLSTFAKKTATRLSRFGKPVQAAASAAAGAGEAAATGAAGAAEAGGAAAAATSIGAVAAPLVAVAVVAAGAAISLKLLSDAVHRTANELADLSPEVAKTQAAFEMNMELARLDRAQRVGAGVAQLEAARNRISESMYEVQTKMLELLIKFSPVLEGALNGINVGVHTFDTLLAMINNIWAQVNDFLNDPAGKDNKAAQDALNDSLVALGKAMSEFAGAMPDNNNGRDPFLEELLAIQGPSQNGKKAPKGMMP